MVLTPLKTVQQAIGSIPAGIKVLESIVETDLAKLEGLAYSEGLKGLVKLSFPILEWLPLRWFKFPTVLDLADNNSMWPPVLDQGQLGSCTDNSVSTCLSLVEAKETGKQLQLSRLFMYLNARAPRNQYTDSGSSVGACARGVRNFGAPPESMWPYDISKFATIPPPIVWQTALQRKLTQSYFTLSLVSILHSLSKGFPVSFSFVMFESFGTMNDTQGWLCPMPTAGEALVGGHTVTIRGFDLTARMFLIQNSWGTGWGLKSKPGCFWMPFDYVLSESLASSWRTFRKVKNT